ncbi:MAG TPA: glycosyltransferase family 41 protein [Gammaproteobacteria bacterium]|nr:glycosyltransferase family 41 protein [Gammaproteobacteria bacterium]
MATLAQALQHALRLHQSDRLQEAEALYRRILRQAPGHPGTLHLLGLLRQQQGDLNEALHLIRLALRAAPGNARFHTSMGMIHQARGDWASARQCYLEALRLDPAEHEARMRLANHAQRTGRLAEAAAHYQTILAREPGHALAADNLGLLHQKLGNAQLALDFHRRALEAAPDNADVHFNRGTALRLLGELDEAREAFEKVLQLKPGDAAACNNLGTILKDQGRVEASLAWFRRAIAADPGMQEAHSNLLFTLSYHLLETPQARFEAHRQWDATHGGPAKARTFEHHPTDVERLRIGYVSPDFRRHAVSRFFEPLLAAHDRAHFEIHCFANVGAADEVTARLRDGADHWHDISGMDDLAAARLIHQQGIHILVDLAGHTARNRLGVFAYRPAPVQATYLGYCATTGLAAMDYWIVDEVTVPPRSPERAVEEIVRLPRCWLSYQVPEDAPEVAAERGGGEAVTFASFNHLSKIDARVVRLWSRLLAELPQARLLLKTRQLTDRRARESLAMAFARHGVAEERLLMEPASSDYLARYNSTDIALDTFPRTGGATTVDALWMGTPVITLAGDFFIERQGASMLSALELPELIAASEDEYLAKAVQLARDPEARQRLHQSLRQRMAESPLCDGRGLAASLERCYRRFWQRCLERAQR